MKLTQEQSAKLLEYLKSKWTPDARCPMCGKDDWGVAEYVFQMLAASLSGGLVLGGPVMPLVPVTCINCGNTVLVNALSAGIVPETKETEVKKVAS